MLDENDEILEREVRVDGNVTLNADFDRRRIGGRIENGRLRRFAGTEDFAATINEGRIAGNGFTNTITRDCPVDAVCVSGSSMGGVFFGPNGEEASGVILFDETTVLDDATTRVVGSGGFLTSDGQ